MIDRILTIFEQWVITVGFAVATLLLFTNVVLRYVFDTGFTWVLEAVQYIFAWVVLIGAAHGVKAGVHLGIDVLTIRFSREVQRWLGLVALAISLGFAIPVLWLAIQYTMKVRRWGDLTLNLEIPQWIPYLAIPIGMALMTYRLVQIGVKIWRGERLHVGQSEHDAVRDREPEPTE
ncbi:MAG: TRAP transporter small permease [Chromatiales bacterium]|nr:TRAP transporter small permease [Chromatiales bacterium]